MCGVRGVLLLIATTIWGSQDYRKHEGSIQRFCGLVVSFNAYGKGPDPCGVTLDLGRPYWDARFRIVIPADARSRFQPSPEDAYWSRNVCVTGRVDIEKNVAQITVAGPDQIEVADRKELKPFGTGAQRLCAGGITAPKLEKEVKPRYTRAAMRALAQGMVLLEAVVLTGGGVGDVRVLYGLHPDLDEEAVRTVKKWKFKPGLHGAEPIPVIVTIEMSFKLK